MGISHLGEDVIKLRYLHLGIEFLTLVVMFCANICFGFFGFSRTFTNYDIVNPNKPSGQRQLLTKIVSAFYYFVWPFSIFSFVVFTPQDYFYYDTLSDVSFWRRIVAFFVIILVLAYMALAHYKWLVGITFYSHTYNELLLSLICVITVLADLFVLWPLVRGGELAIPTIVFGVSCLLLSAILSRAYTYLRDVTVSDTRLGVYSGLSALLLFSSFIFMSFLLLIASYVNGVLINIPSTKGGADFTHAPSIKVCFKNEKMFGGCLKGVLSVYETSTTIYLARIEPGNDPCKWKTLSNKPNLIQINRSEIAYAEFSSVFRPASHFACP